MIPCPSCGNQEYHESRQCPKYDGQSVCIRCCRECGYYDPSPMALRCRWHISHPRQDYQAEIEKLTRQIRIKEKQAEHFYKNDQPWIAEKIEAELSWIRHDRRKMEEKRDEELKKTGAAT